MSETVAILGASDNPDRFSHKAQRLLLEKGYTPIPINPGHHQVDGLTCYPDLASCPAAVDTITVYVRPTTLHGLIDDIINVEPKRVILNPGTSDPAIKSRLQENGIDVQVVCTLVLLESDQF